jgi:glycosyltransferase involved in cell wall biosynthesis
MRFVIEALGMTSGGGKAGLLRLLPALASHREHSFVALLADLPEFAGLERPNLRLIPQKKPGSLVAREIYLQRTVPRVCDREEADALLCLGNFGPRRATLPTVVLLHNAHYVRGRLAGVKPTLREALVAWYGRRYFRGLPEAVRLVVQTELMKQRVVTVFGASPSRVLVIRDADALPPEAQSIAGDCRTGSQAKNPPQTQDEATSAHSPFTFLCLSQYYPHKNLEVLVEAMKRLPAYTQRPARCLLTIHENQHPGARRLLHGIAREGLDAVLVNIGPVSAARLAEVYRSADAFVLPTLLESFGRTYLEAMRFGLPVLTSDRDFARHLCGEAALYFDPLDPGSVAQNMARIIEDRQLAARLIVEGQRNVRQIPTWEDIAAQFVAVLEEAATDPRDSAVRVPLSSGVRQLAAALIPRACSRRSTTL